MNDNICAISTSISNNAISIIKCTGPNTFSIVNKLVKFDLNKMKANTIKYFKLYYENEFIDEVLISKFIGPNSYDGFDTIEINCHGGVLITKKILSILLSIGFRMAGPGEFSYRAFINKKMSLSKAESIMSLINSESNMALKISTNGINDRTNKLIDKFITNLKDLLMKVEINIDYPEYYDDAYADSHYVFERIDRILLDFDLILQNSKISKAIVSGIKTSIIGYSNVGKSSLLNFLLDEEKSIVYDKKGTTRDVVEGKLNLGNFSLILYDTAGIRKTFDNIESIGVNKSFELIEKSDLILFVLDSSRKINKVEKEILNIIEEKKKNYIIVFNKKDLKNNINIDLNNKNYVYISALNKEGLLDLKKVIEENLNLNSFNENILALTNERQINHLNKAFNYLNEIKANSLNQFFIEIVALNLKLAIDELLNLQGKYYDEHLVDDLFKNFCLGK